VIDQGDKLIFTWDDFKDAVYKLSKRIHPGAFSNPVVVGQMRGGMPLAVALSHAFGWPMASSDCLQHGFGWPYSFILWADDIIDSGKTYYEAKAMAANIDNGFKPFSIFIREDIPNPNHFYFVHRVPKGKWVVFPWENLEKADLDREQYRASRQ